MNKAILIGLSTLTTGLLIAVIAAPLGVQQAHKAKMEETKSTMVDNIKLSATGQEFFSKLSSNQVEMQTEVDKTENLTNWLNWFEVFNGNGNTIAPINSITDITIKTNNTTKMFEADLELTWKEGFDVSSLNITNYDVEIKAFEEVALKEVTLNYLNDDSFRLLTQNFIWVSPPEEEPITNLAELNALLDEVETEWNSYPEEGEESLESFLTSMQLVDDASSIESVELLATAGTQYNIEWKFNPKIGYEILNPTKKFDNLLQSIPDNTVAFTIHDELIKENVLGLLSGAFPFTNLDELNVFLQAMGAGINTLLINPEIIDGTSTQLVATNGDGENQYDLTVTFTGAEGITLTNPTKIFDNITILPAASVKSQK